MVVKPSSGKSQVEAVHPEGEFTFQAGEIGLLEAGTVADDEAALAAVLIFERRQLADASRAAADGRRPAATAPPLPGIHRLLAPCHKL